MDIYTDGSYLNGVAKWAFIVVEDDEVVHSASGVITDPTITQGYQVGGETQACIEAVKWAEQTNNKITIFYDFANLRHWVAEIWGEKSWKTNKSYTKRYAEFMIENQEWIKEMIKVKGHSNNYFNNCVDKLASKSK